MRLPALSLAGVLALAAAAVGGDETAAPAPGVLVAFPDGAAFVLDADTGETLFSVKTAAKEWRVARREKEGGAEIACRSLPVALFDERVLAVEGTELVTYDRDGKRFAQDGSDHLEGAAFLHAGRRGEDVLAATPGGKMMRFWRTAQWKDDLLLHTGPPGPVRGEAKADGLSGSVGASAFHGPRGTWILADDAEGFAAFDAPSLKVRDVAVSRLGYPPILALAISPDGTRLAVSHGANLRVKTFTLLEDGRIRGHEDAFKENGAARALAWSRDAALLAIGSDTGDVRVVRGRKDEGSSSGFLPLVSHATPGRSPVRLLHFLKDPALLLAVDDEGVARTIRWEKGELAAERKLR